MRSIIIIGALAIIPPMGPLIVAALLADEARAMQWSNWVRRFVSLTRATSRHRQQDRSSYLPHNFLYRQHRHPPDLSVPTGRAKVCTNKSNRKVIDDEDVSFA